MWSAPAERSGDGALDYFEVLRLANPKRSRATLASHSKCSPRTPADYWQRVAAVAKRSHSEQSLKRSSQELSLNSNLMSIYAVVLLLTE
jgi:hypothetical protein